MKKIHVKLSKRFQNIPYLIFLEEMQVYFKIHVIYKLIFNNSFTNFNRILNKFT